MVGLGEIFHAIRRFRFGRGTKIDRFLRRHFLRKLNAKLPKSLVGREGWHRLKQHFRLLRLMLRLNLFAAKARPHGCTRALATGTLTTRQISCQAYESYERGDLWSDRHCCFNMLFYNCSVILFVQLLLVASVKNKHQCHYCQCSGCRVVYRELDGDYDYWDDEYYRYDTVDHQHHRNNTNNHKHCTHNWSTYSHR